ncbi:MAG: cytochrome c biogenesis protein CcdA [Planctomycetaceae bacterium]
MIPNRRPTTLLLAAALTLATCVRPGVVFAQVGKAPVKVTAALQSQQPVAPGAEAIVEVVAEITSDLDSKGKHWHIYPRREQHQGIEIPTSITVESEAPAITIGETVWPAPGFIQNAFNELQPAYEGRVVFSIPVTVAADAAPGKYALNIAFRYQTCASLCLPPTTEKLTVALTVAGDSPGAPPESPPVGNAADSPATSGDDSLGTDTAPAPSAPGEPTSDDSGHAAAGSTANGTESAAGDFQTNVFGTNFGFSANSAFAIPLLLLFAFVGGFLLNLTPCVLPIIPIKIMGLTQSAAGDARRSRVLGVSMGLGILAFWLAIGAAISFVSGFDSISSLFQRPVFGISVGLFIAFMGIGMLVDMTIQLPQAVHRINPKHDTLHGAFLFGVMTAVLSTPCTAPFMGSAAAWATKANSPGLVLAVFASIAIGMGWPYVLLSWYPKLVSKVPRTGPASVLVKQVMGLLMLAVAAFFGGTGVLGLVKQHPHLGPVLHWWIATGFVAVMSVWLTLQTFRITKSTVKRIGYSLLSLALFAGMAIWSNGETADSWEAMVRHDTETEQMKAYVTQLEEAVRNGAGRHVLQLRPPPWQDYDPQRYASARASGQVAIVHFTADW